ncbi:MAG: TetR/AcrR family transcriptional regulator [Deltaproteobacteria bacterium]|nr:TetR/AcrR family transcriptional regulator [Deltaproteobacteria bacterium]
MAAATPNLTRILTSAQKLILSKGFPATRIDEICEAAGVTKGGFYYHFGSKDELALAVIDRYFDGIVEALTLEDPVPDDPREKVLAFIAQAIEVARGPVLRDGCVLGVLTLDLAETHPEIRLALAERFSGVAKALEGDLVAARESSPSWRGGEPSSLARQFLVALEGGLVLAKAHDDPGLAVEALEHYRMALEAALPAPEIGNG